MPLPEICRDRSIMAIAMENQTPVVQMPLVPASPLPPPPPPPPPLPQAYKHHCKVCKKGFVCGRALGGHMRAHGVADDVLSADDDDEEDNVFDDDGAGSFDGDSSSEQASPSATTSKRMYTLRANPGRLKSCRVCENCGEEFTSWKSLLDHGRCNNYEDGDGGTDGSTRRSPPLLDEEEVVEEDMALATAGWSKGKRTRRTKMMGVGNGSVTEMTRLRATSPSSEEEDLANCLVMLSSSRSAQPPPAVSDADQESCASASKDVVDRNRLLVPQPISMMAPAVPQLKLLAPPQPASTVPRGLFECKACKKVFTSHQALGGHRASHKKVKGCFAAKLESDRRERPQPVTATPRENIKVVDAKTPSVHTANADGNTSTSGVVTATAAPETAVTQANEAPSMSAASPAKKKGKVHECSICHRVFMSGQALGGHKRCHWLTTGSGDPITGAVSKFHPIVAQDHVMHAVCQQLTLGRPIFSAAHPSLDLNNVPTNPSAAMKQAAELNDSVLCLNAPASLYMPSWTAVHSNGINVNKAATSSRNVDEAGAAATEDEADSRNAKKRKISDLKDMNMAGETSPWLQVGIGLRSESKEKSIQE